MSRKYSILIVSSEIAPFARTGGLGDMVAALAAGFRRHGHDVCVVLPAAAWGRLPVVVRREEVDYRAGEID